MRTITRENKTVGGRSRNTERLYNELNKMAIPEWEEQFKLIKHYKRTGCAKTREAILNANMLFVVKIARQYMSSKNPVLHSDDLTSQGVIGLCKALEKYDIHSGNRFSSYAVWWIRQSIVSYIDEFSQPIRTPASSAEIYKAIKEMKDQGIKPAAHTIAELLRAKAKRGSKFYRVQPETIAAFLAVKDKPISTNKAVPNMDGLTYEDLMSDDSYTPEIIEFSENVENAMECLSEREVHILNEYFGIGRDCPLTLQEIANDLDLVRERVRQIKNKALKKLRVRLQKTGV